MWVKHSYFNTDVTYQTVSLFGSDKCFIYLLHFWCSTLHLMKSAQHCLYNSGIKVDILDTCGAMICSYFGIAFLLFFIRIENAVYTSCQNSALLFINGLIFDITNTQNNQSLEFEWKQMLAPLRSVNDRRFLWIKLFQASFSYSKIGWILFKNTKETLQEAGQKIFISWGGKHMKDWK